jgi:hypothetical protein
MSALSRVSPEQRTLKRTAAQGSSVPAAMLRAPLSVQRLALLKEAVPRLTRVGVLANPNNYGTEAYLG